MNTSLNAFDAVMYAPPQTPVRIGIVTPYVKTCWSKLPQGGLCPHVDHETEFVVMLMRALNWSYVLVPTDEYGYQYVNDSTQWNGLVEEVFFQYLFNDDFRSDKHCAMKSTSQRKR